VPDLTVSILNRPRNEDLVRRVRAAGARIRLIGDGDVAAAAMAMMPDHDGVDMLMGIGGSPEGVISACTACCLGGDMQARLWPRSDDDRRMAEKEGIDIDRLLTLNDLCSGENVFVAATGVTDGELLAGVRYSATGAVTDSIVARSVSGTTRRIEAHHDFTRLRKLAGLRFE
jgi:fructose-1,6-bisphosphatase II